MSRHQVQRYIASCLSQSRTRISSTFWSQVCLLSRCRHCIFCNRPSHFVRLSECSLKILPQNLFSFFFHFLVYMLFPVDTLVLQKKKKLKPKEKSHPYIFSVCGSIFQDTFSRKPPSLEMLLGTPTCLQHLPLPAWPPR